MTIRCSSINPEPAKNPHPPSRHPPSLQLHPLHAPPHRKQPFRPAPKTSFQATQNSIIKALPSKTNNSPIFRHQNPGLPHQQPLSKPQSHHRPPLPLRLPTRTSRTRRPHHPPHKRLPRRHQFHQLHPPTPLVPLPRPALLRFRPQTLPKQQTQRTHGVGPKTGRRAAVGV